MILEGKFRLKAQAERLWDLLLEPEICTKLAELQGKRMLRQIPIFAQLGVDGIMPCGDLGHSQGMLASPEIYRRMVYPWHKAMSDLAHAHGLKILKHCCGQVWPVIQELAEVYDAYEGIQASGGMDIKRLKEEVGDRLCLWGAIDGQHVLVEGDVDDVRKHVSEVVQIGQPTGFVAGPTHTFTDDTPIDNILAAYEVLRN